MASSFSSAAATTPRRLVDSVSYGVAPLPEELEDAESVRFTIPNFGGRNESRGDCIESPVVKAHGYEWSILVFPNGTHDSRSVSIYLCSKEKVSAAYAIRCKDLYVHATPSPQTFLPNEVNYGGFKDFECRYALQEGYLEPNGSLVIEIDIRIASRDKRAWYPPKVVPQDLWVKLYNDTTSETADVVFLVTGELFPVHKCLLYLRAKKLYEIARESSSGNREDGETAPIPLSSVRGEIFRKLLEFLYTVGEPKLPDKEVATEVLVAADCFEVVDLKLYAESVLADEFLAPPNAAELLLLADAHACALLKEAAIDSIVSNGITAKKAKAWSRVQESQSLVDELFDACFRKLGRTGDGTSIEEDENETENETENDRLWRQRLSDLLKLDVSGLRKKLQENKLDLDGSREVLVQRLVQQATIEQVEKENESESDRVLHRTLSDDDDFLFYHSD